jgi:hypothetical protein
VYGPNTSLNHDPAPIHVVRGEGSRLFDAEGRPYLDCVNNVAHVGHANPAVLSLALGCLGVPAHGRVRARPRSCRPPTCSTAAAPKPPPHLGPPPPPPPRPRPRPRRPHPSLQVAKAIADQMFTVNTNSRYLSHGLVDLSQQLLGLLPDPLEVRACALLRGVRASPALCPRA